MRIVPLAVLLLIAAACGGNDSASITSAGNGGSPDPPPATGETRYTATSTVLESPDHGPQLCLGIVLESYPPQCGGPDVIGWDWHAVDGEEAANGTTWGTYTVVGTWDGEALTLTEPAAPPEQPDPSTDDRERLSTPCPEPDGGWRVVDESMTSREAMDAAIEHARSQRSSGGVWLDQSINPAFDEEPIDEARANDPARTVLNLSFTEDLDRHEAAIRELWGGPLCVSEATISAIELAEIRAEVEAEVDDLLFSSADEVHGHVEIGVPVDDGLQQRFDERYGAGVVEVRAQLRPVGH